jgi:hypothetical protein
MYEVGNHPDIVILGTHMKSSSYLEDQMVVGLDVG